MVLDTSAFVAGFDPLSVEAEQYVVPAVIDEFIGDSSTKMRFNLAMESGKLKVKKPDDALLTKVETAAATIGDLAVLSVTDIQILALALQLKIENRLPLIITDDYAIQNVARHLGIEYAPLATFGIRKPIKWIRYCPACHQRYPAEYKNKYCILCGMKLKRKPRKISIKSKKGGTL
ncbi:MAG: ribonuclease VapC [Nitrososphaerota archaeon]|nr:ribonuclease VapC [Candidatus Bathyarchaeota archaeon]MDW8193312.1 ribonuclease VapC [Nitrososphaerota archaeon]